MADTIHKLDPFRWKVFQSLPVESENDASKENTEPDKRKRNANKVLITDKQFKAFCDRHEHLRCFVPESNQLMASSYLIVDESLRFLGQGHWQGDGLGERFGRWCAEGDEADAA